MLDVRVSDMRVESSPIKTGLCSSFFDYAVDMQCNQRADSFRYDTLQSPITKFFGHYLFLWCF